MRVQSVRWQRALVIAAVGWMAVAPPVRAAETVEPSALRKTLIILKLDTTQSVAVRAAFSERPPILTLEFPRRQVISSLPERSALAKGPIQLLMAGYDPASGHAPRRFLKTLQVVMSAAYPYRVHAEPGRVVIEIEHPASLGGTSVEIGLLGGTIVEGLGRGGFSERFRAMQDALAQATPIPWSMQFSQLGGAPAGVSASPAAAPAPNNAPGSRLAAPPPGAGGSPKADRRRSQPGSPFAPPISGARIPWLLLAAAVALVGTALMRRRSKQGTPQPPNGRAASGVALIDLLVWKAFERQGYALVAESSLDHPLTGTLRIIVKDGAKAALFFVGSGIFFERQTVQGFLHLMRKACAAQGFLAASGSFTIPAQRLAKERQVTLIGRDQLTELLSAGAQSEYVTKQLDEQQARLDEAKETARQYARELDTLRRQRNEASWFLGEERARSATLEAQVEDMSRQLRTHEEAVQRWEQDAEALRRQWEESEWYLGESRARARYLDGQLAAAQDVAKRVEAAEHERSEAAWYLGEERARGEALEARLAQLQQRVEESTSRECSLAAALERLRAELTTFRTYGERRRWPRCSVPQVRVEVRHGKDDPIVAGAPRDVSGGGVGMEADGAISLPARAKIFVTVPGQEPILSRAELMWQRAPESPAARQHAGYRLLGLSREKRALLAQIIQEAQPSPRA